MPPASPTSTPARPSYGGIFDFDGKAERLVEVSQLLEDPRVWDDAKRAQDLGREKKTLDDVVGQLTTIGARLRDAADLFSLARDEADDATVVAVEADALDIESAVAGMEFRRMFADPLDPNNCFVDLQAGSGGTEAQDWASILQRMYTRYADKKGFTVSCSNNPMAKWRASRARR